MTQQIVEQLSKALEEAQSGMFSVKSESDKKPLRKKPTYLVKTPAGVQ